MQLLHISIFELFIRQQSPQVFQKITLNIIAF